jgi:hypothetical protein
MRQYTRDARCRVAVEWAAGATVAAPTAAEMTTAGGAREHTRRSSEACQQFLLLFSALLLGSRVYISAWTVFQ